MMLLYKVQCYFTKYDATLQSMVLLYKLWCYFINYGATLQSMMLQYVLVITRRQAPPDIGSDVIQCQYISGNARAAV